MGNSLKAAGHIQEVQWTTLGKNVNWKINLNEVIALCIYIFTLLLYITVNTTTIEYNANAACFDLQQSSSGYAKNRLCFIGWLHTTTL